MVGLLFAELARVWTAGVTGKPNPSDLNPTLPAELRYRVPLTMASGVFLFVAVCELIGYWFRELNSAAAVARSEAQDEAEKLLNELLAQAEAKVPTEARSQEPTDKGQETEE